MSPRALHSKLRALAPLWLLVVGACGGDPPARADTAPKDAAPDAAEAATTLPDPPRYPPLDDPFTCEPTLASIQQNVFFKTCQWDTCHSTNGAAFGLRLTGDLPSVEAELVSHATACNGMLLVAPGDPAASYLMEKLTAEKPACGARMPWGYEPLPDAALECIRGWISSL